MRPLHWGERLDQWGRLPHRQRRRFLTPPGYGSARRRRRPCSRPRRRCGTGGPRWWRVPTPSCSGVGKVGPEFEVPEVLGDRPAVLRCAVRISANSTWTEGKSGARRSASAHCCPARRCWPCMARGQCSSGSVASWARPVSSSVSASRHLPVEYRAAARSHLATVMPGLSLSPVRNVAIAPSCLFSSINVRARNKQQVTSTCPPIFIQREAECQYLTHGLGYQRFICRILRKKLDPYTGKVVALSTKLYIL